MEKVNHFEEINKRKIKHWRIYKCEKCGAKIGSKQKNQYNGLCKKCHSSIESEYHNTLKCARECWYTAPDICYQSSLDLDEFGYSVGQKATEY